MSAPTTTVMPNDDSTGFSSVITHKKDSRRLKKDQKDRQKPSTSRFLSQRTATPSSSSFGRSSWVKPKRQPDAIQNATDVSGGQSAEMGADLRVDPNRGLPESSLAKEPTQEPSVAVVGELTQPLCGAGDHGLPESRDLGFQESAASQSLSEMLAEYGEQDLEWHKVVPSALNGAPTQDITESTIGIDTSDQGGRNALADTSCGDNRLVLHGKAPIHVEFVSFGFRHGAPFELRQGWSHALPLPAWDTRESLPTQVPPYLAWQDGLSGAVRRALLMADGSTLRSLAKSIADQVATALLLAMTEGGHGYAFPLNVKVFVGSEMGRHRSVVVAEMAATSLRKLLRANAQNRFACPCSVGLHHRDLERKQAQSTCMRPKKKDVEDD